jgi:polar amino acid transport system substrate-binding protein
MPIDMHSARAVAALLVVASLLGACESAPTSASPSAVTSDATVVARQALAPTGTLRIAAYAGSPTSLVRRPGSDEPAGMSIDIGREMARRLGVPARIVEFERVEQVIDSLRNEQADVTLTNASAARAALVDFTEPMVALELGYLVMPGSPVASIADIDRAGVRVGVSQGSSSQAALTKAYHDAIVVPATSLTAAASMLQDHRIDAFATNKGVLFQMADGLAGARVLEGRWGAESLAIAVPKGRIAGKAWLEDFVTSVRNDGRVQHAAQRAGLRGLAEPEVRP